MDNSAKPFYAPLAMIGAFFFNGFVVTQFTRAPAVMLAVGIALIGASIFVFAKRAKLGRGIPLMLLSCGVYDVSLYVAYGIEIGRMSKMLGNVSYVLLVAAAIAAYVRALKSERASQVATTTD